VLIACRFQVDGGIIRSTDEYIKFFLTDGVAALDCGANIGVHTIAWGRLMQDWGSVISFEAQEKIYSALAGNVILNNLMNVKAVHAAVSDREGSIEIPQPDYIRPASFGSLELRQRPDTQNIGQRIDYTSGLLTVRTISIDSLRLPRLDVLKMDVEGMEEQALAGARETLARCKPIACVEVIKSNPQQLSAFFMGLGYRLFPAGLNLLAVHPNDPCARRMAS
jgi:FkbM family methyltransferase